MATATESKTKQKTTYNIFKSIEAEVEGEVKQLWDLVASAEGLSDQKAIQAHIASSGDTDGTFAAVPARSFRSRTVAVETNPRVRIS